MDVTNCHVGWRWFENWNRLNQIHSWDRRTPAGEASRWSWKGTFFRERGLANSSGLHLASSRFSKNYCPEIDMANFFAKLNSRVSRIWSKITHVSWKNDFHPKIWSGRFKKKFQTCPDLLLDVFKNFKKSVRICVNLKAPLPLTGDRVVSFLGLLRSGNRTPLQKGLGTNCQNKGHRRLSLLPIKLTLASHSITSTNYLPHKNLSPGSFYSMEREQ